jgi:chlorophyllide a reductase subunit Y
MVVSGYEGSELLVARLLIEAGAEIPYVGTALPRTAWSDPDREWLESRGVHVQYRASLEQDVAAMRDVKPDLALGTTPLVQAAKEQGTPAVYFTNMVSARPLFGAAGCAALPAIVAAQTAGRERFGRMIEFFEKPKVAKPVIVPTKKPAVAGAA